MSIQVLGRSVLVSFLLAMPMAEAQTEAPQEVEAVPQQEVEAEPQPIPEGLILSLSDVVAADLRRIEAVLQPSAEVSRIADDLPELETSLVELLADLDVIDPRHSSARYLEDQRVSWLELRMELNRWSSIVASRFDDLQTERQKLREMRSQWEATRANADATELPSDFLRRIETTLSRILEVEGRVREQRNAVGAIGDRIAGDLEKIASSLDSLNELTSSRRAGLIERDSPPLWLSLGAIDARSLVDEWKQVGRDWFEALIAYISLRLGRLFSLLVLFSVLLIGAIRLRRESPEWPVEDKSFDIARRLVQRPVSLALVFAGVIDAITTPLPPGAVVDVLLVLTCVAAVRVGPLVLGSGSRKSLYMVGILVVLSRIGSLMADSSVTSQVLMLGVSAVAFGGASRAALRARRSQSEPSKLDRFTYVVMAVSTALFGIAVGASLLGWTGLSRVLTQATLESLFSLFTWAIVVASVSALLPAVLAGWVGSVLPSLRREQDVVYGVVGRATRLLAVVAWTLGTMRRFHIRSAAGEWVQELASAGFSIGGLTFTVGTVLAVVIILIVTRWIAQLVGFALREELMPRFDVRSSVGQSIATLANYTVWGVGFVLVAAAIGLSGAQLTMMVGALGVGIGFGLQNIVNNFVSGLILIFGRPISVGDTVQTVDHWGRVTKIGMRASTIRSFDGAEIIVPNGDLISKEVINWTRSDEIRRFEVLVGVAYGTDPEAVLEILRRLAEEHPQTLEEPEPQVHMIDFADSSLDFRLRCWAPMSDWVTVASDLRVAINNELKVAGIQIPFPQRDLHMKSTVAPTKNDEDQVSGPTKQA